MRASMTERSGSFLEHHPRHRKTTTSEPDFWVESDELPSEPARTLKARKTRDTEITTEDAESSEEHKSTESEHFSDDEDVQLCKKPSFQVVLNPAKNSRELRFGDDAEAATRLKGKPLVQSLVRCRGRPQPSCLKAKPDCDISPARCPCEFEMDKLPPLDHEYIYMAQEVLDAQEECLEHAAKDITLRRAGAERWLGEEAKMKMLAAKNDAGYSWRVAMIGLGGGMLPQYLLQHSHDLSIDGVESSSDVIDVARAFFGITELEKTGRLKVIANDGMSFLQDSPVEHYNSIIVDCFGDGGVPEGCRSSDFVQALYKTLKQNSNALQNVIMRHPANEELDASNRKDFTSLLSNYQATFGKEAVIVQRGQGEKSTNAVIRAYKS